MLSFCFVSRVQDDSSSNISRHSNDASPVAAEDASRADRRSHRFSDESMRKKQTSSPKAPTPPPASNKPKGKNIFPVGYHSLGRSPRHRKHPSPSVQRKIVVDMTSQSGGTLPRLNKSKLVKSRQLLMMDSNESLSSAGGGGTASYKSTSNTSTISRGSTTSHSFREAGFRKPR